MSTAQLLVENDSLTKQQEKAARLIAAGDLTREAIAEKVRVGVATVYRWQSEAVFRERVRQLREDFRASAMDAAPFADKRLRVVALDAVAHDTLDALKTNDYEETYYYGPDALEAKRFDKARVAEFRAYLAEIAEEMGDRGGAQSASVNVNVGVAVTLTPEERVGRLASLLARLDPGGA